MPVVKRARHGEACVQENIKAEIGFTTHDLNAGPGSVGQYGSEQKPGKFAVPTALQNCSAHSDRNAGCQESKINPALLKAEDQQGNIRGCGERDGNDEP